MDKQTPAISVVVPVYNREKHLQKCLDSICNQTFRNIEIIIVDDGSTDLSGKIADDAADKDSRIKVIHQQNAHASAARNAGLSIVVGKYVMFTDSDDWIEPDTLEVLYTKAEFCNMDVVVFGMAVEYTKDKSHVDMRVDNYRESINRTDLQSLYLELLSRSLIASPCNKLYRVALLKKHSIRFYVQPPFEDEVFNLDVLMVADNICILPSVFYHYMRNDELSIVSSYKADFLDAYKNKLLVYDRFFAALDMNKQWIDGFLADNMILTYSVYLQNLYKKNACLRRKDRVRIIRKEIYGNTSLITIIKQRVPSNTYRKIFRFLLLNCSPSVTDLVYQVLFFFRYRLESVYRSFRKRNLK